MPKYRIHATYTVCLYADVEAKSSEDAFYKGIDMDGSDFIETNLGDWTIESDPELIEESEAINE